MLAPLGTTVWIVADTKDDGIPASTFDNGAGSTVPRDQLLGPDDVIIKVDLTDGVAPFSFAGRYFSGAVFLEDDPEASNEKNYPVVPKTSQFFFFVWGVPSRGSEGIGVLGMDSGLHSPAPFPATPGDVRGDGSMSFGFFNMGTTTIPPVGNGLLGVYDNVFADHMTVVPEPAAYAAAGAGALLGFALLRRKTARRA